MTDSQDISDEETQPSEMDDLQGWFESGERLIYPSMIRAMRLVKAVGKAGWNEQQKYKFRGIDGVLDAVGPALREAGVFVTSEIVEVNYRDTRTTLDKPTREVTARIRYTFHAVDGSTVSTEVAGESLDQSDKGTAKAFSVALRIALLQTLALPTQEPTTDDTGQYHTRGADTLSSWTRRYGLSLLTAEVPDVKVIMEFWPAVVEAGQTDAVASGQETGITWHELIAETLARAIASVTTAEEGRALHAILKPTGALHWMHEGLKLGDRMVNRGAQIKIDQAKAFDHCMALILAADDFAALDAAVVHIKADRDEGPLSQEQLDQLNAVAVERHNKIVAAREVETVEPPRQYLPPVGAAWDQFVAAASTEPMDADQLDGLITGEGDITPACEFGADGVQRVIDAVKKAHQRDHSISAVERAELFSVLKAHMFQYGITWHEPIS